MSEVERNGIKESSYSIAYRSSFPSLHTRHCSCTEAIYTTYDLSSSHTTARKSATAMESGSSWTGCQMDGQQSTNLRIVELKCL